MGIAKKIRTARSVYNNDGVLGMGIITIAFMQKHFRRKKGSKYKRRVDTDALYNDVLSFDLSRKANENWVAPIKDRPLIINWLMPPPGEGSGGHMTLFRFINFFEQSGNTCRLYFHKPGPGSTIQGVLDSMGGSFPTLKATMEWLHEGTEMADADAVFATSWQTAYTVYASKSPAKKFYFVQDFEPHFYPVGGISILAENTYRMGLRGITAGGWLEKKLHDEYGMVTTKFDFGSDSSYTFENEEKRNEIVFYARPTTPRRAFEFGVMVLDIFHQLHPEYIINFIGWDVSEFSIPFPHNNMGILDKHGLNELYNRCSASLVMSLTNMSLLPLELLATGCIPVVNDGPNNRLVSDNPFIEYCQADPKSMAETLSRVVSRKDLPKYAKKASVSVADCSWEKSGQHIIETIKKSVYTNGPL